MKKRTRKPILVFMQIFGIILLIFWVVSGILNLFSLTISSLIGIISMLLIIPESIDFFMYVLKNFPEEAFVTYKGRIILLPLFLIGFFILFIISLKN